MLYTLPCQGQCGNLSSASLLLLSFTCIIYLVCYPSIEDVLRDDVHGGWVAAITMLTVLSFGLGEDYAYGQTSASTRVIYTTGK